METKEVKFLEKNILDLLKVNKEVEIEDIIDYLDYINKVRYLEKDIIPIVVDLNKREKLGLKIFEKTKIG